MVTLVTYNYFGILVCAVDSRLVPVGCDESTKVRSWTLDVKNNWTRTNVDTMRQQHKKLRPFISRKCPGLSVFLSLFCAYQCYGIWRWIEKHRDVGTGYAMSTLRHDNDVIPTNATTMTSERHEIDRLNRIYFVAQFGLGHRFSKLSAAYHLAYKLGVPVLEQHWGSCQTAELDIFTYLFGTHRLVVPVYDATGEPRPSTQLPNRDVHDDKTILIRNDVAGYYAGQSYKNAQIPIPQSLVALSRIGDHRARNTWSEKLALDRHLFRELLLKFIHRYPAIASFQREHEWDDSIVIGLHLRVGNGEQNHFQTAGRSISNTSKFVGNVCGLLDRFLSKDFLPNSKILLFVATDTSSVIPMVERYCSVTPLDDPIDTRRRSNQTITVLAYPQLRVPENGGVSYQVWERGDNCLRGWLASMTDMALLSQAHVLIAGMRSTFTQIMPLSIVLDNDTTDTLRRNRPRRREQTYCEVSETGETMSCFTDMISWLFRRGTSHTFNLDSVDSSQTVPVVHKVLVHLPEPSVDDAENELTISAVSFLRDRSLKHQSMVYGSRFNSKYRTAMDSFRRDWTWGE